MFKSLAIEIIQRNGDVLKFAGELHIPKAVYFFFKKWNSPPYVLEWAPPVVDFGLEIEADADIWYNSRWSLKKSF